MIKNNSEKISISENPVLLLVDDDEVFCQVLSGALSKRGFEVHAYESRNDAVIAAKKIEPEYAVVDLCIGNDSGLEVVEELINLDPNTRIVMLTGYSSVATAIEAIKLGAKHYLTKPSDADEIVNALHKDEGDSSIELSRQPVSVKRLEWEHLQKVLADNDGNVSAAARALNMHRRTLQRKLQKRPVKQ